MNRQAGLTASTEAWRRRQALALRAKGWPLSAIAEALAVTPGAVSQWLKAAREGGEQALESRRSRTGARPKLTPEQWARLLELLGAGAQAPGQVGERWNGERVAALIRKEFGVSYLPTSVPGLLRRVGWTPQKPQVLAAQREEEQIARFQDDWAAVKKGQRRKGARP